MSERTPRFRMEYSDMTGSVHVITPDWKHILGEVHATLKSNCFYAYKYPQPCVGPIRALRGSPEWPTYPTQLEAAKAIAGVTPMRAPDKTWGED